MGDLKPLPDATTVDGHEGRLTSRYDIRYNIFERKKRLARTGIRRPNSQLGPALRLTTGRANFYNLTLYILLLITVYAVYIGA